MTVESVTFGRYAPKIERGVYYCCLEALQNAVKHAGPNAAVWIRLVGEPNRVSFSVDDSGVGFDPAHVATGVGLVNLADRVDVLGGRLTVDSMPGMGTRIHGGDPARPRAPEPAIPSIALPISRALRRPCQAGGRRRRRSARGGLPESGGAGPGGAG